MGQSEEYNRRGFLRHGAAGVGTGMLGAGMLGGAAAGGAREAGETPARRLPREVWIASVSQNDLTARTYQEMTGKLLARAEEAAPLRPDVVCLPEVGPFVNLASGERPPLEQVAETPPGPLTRRFADFAKSHRCYVWAPIYTRHGGKFFNALVLLDRQGQVVGEYQKMHPTPEEMEKGISPGPLNPPVFRTDFGVIGAQICYDLFFNDGWQRLHENGAEIVFWSSAYAGGRKLNMVAGLHRYVVVSSTRKNVTRICDISGESLAWTGFWEHWLCAPVNLEKALIPTWPDFRKFDAIRKKYGQAIQITTYHDEEVSILESRAPEVKVADVLKEFKIKTYNEVVRESTSREAQYRQGRETTT